MIFELKSDLNKAARDEIDRIESIPVAQRLTSEAAFLTALAPYLTNEVIERDSEDLITKAAGNTVPTSYPGFKKGALFTKKDAVGGGLYQNTGDETSATWSLVTDTDNNLIATGTPVNAVAASKVLTVGGLPTEGKIVTIGDNNYRWRDALEAAVAAASTLAFGANAGDGKVVVLGNRTFTFQSALTEAKALGTLTSSGNFVDSEKVLIGGVTYTFTVNLTGAANEIKIGATASDSLDNLIAAINHAAGEGTTYGTGTVVHPTVTAAAGAGDTAVITAKTIGVAGNSIATTVVAASASFGAVTLEGGVNAIVDEILIGAGATNSLDNLIAAIMHTAGEGTTYSTGTVEHTQVTAAAGDGDTVVVTAKTAGTAGNSIATTTDITSATWTDTTLVGGEGSQAANDVLIGVSAEACIDNLVAAITFDDGLGTNEGTLYGTGTVAHPSVTAAKTNSSTMTATAKVKGTTGNSIVIGEDDTNTSWAGGAVLLGGGVNGTVGGNGAILKDSSYLYIAIAANTIADANWRRLTVGSVY